MKLFPTKKQKYRNFAECLLEVGTAIGYCPTPLAKCMDRIEEAIEKEDSESIKIEIDEAENLVENFAKRLSRVNRNRLLVAFSALKKETTQVKKVNFSETTDKCKFISNLFMNADDDTQSKIKAECGYILSLVLGCVKEDGAVEEDAVKEDYVKNAIDKCYDIVKEKFKTVENFSTKPFEAETRTHVVDMEEEKMSDIIERIEGFEKLCTEDVKLCSFAKKIRKTMQCISNFSEQEEGMRLSVLEDLVDVLQVALTMIKDKEVEIDETEETEDVNELLDDAQELETEEVEDIATEEIEEEIEDDIEEIEDDIEEIEDDIEEEIEEDAEEEIDEDVEKEIDEDAEEEIDEDKQQFIDEQKAISRMSFSEYCKKYQTRFKDKKVKSTTTKQKKTKIPNPKNFSANNNKNSYDDIVDILAGL